MKRKHQIEMEKARDDIIAGQNIEYILASVTPGGGKSALPIIISKLIDAGKADKICWVVPRKSLQSQGEHNFMDPFFRDLFDHKNRIRTSTNDNDPSRGLEGCITTYQAIGLDENKTLLKDFRRRKYILVLDEFHHAGEGSTWEGALNRLVSSATYVVLMTGTLQRGDGTAIAFLPYASRSGDKVPILESSEQLGLRVIQYSRVDALAEKAIIPLVFNFADAKVSWLTEMGDQVDCDSIAGVKQKDASDAIYTALTTEYAEQLLDQAIAHWSDHKHLRNTRSRMLVVTAGIETAKRALSYLKRKCYNAEIATSHESKAAHEAINRFKRGNIEILVTIAMAYEGLDVPSVTHLVSLTHIRSRPWIEQMLARAVRVDHLAGAWEDQRAYIWTPDDPLMRKIVNDIEAEQVAHVTSYKSGDQIELFGNEGEGEGPGRRGIVPLASSIVGSREAILGPDQSRMAPSSAPTEKTPSELEAELREDIEKHVRAFSFMHRYRNGRINGEIRRAMNKARAEMTLQELRQCLAYVRQTYPLTAKQFTRVSGISGPRTHRKRVSTQGKIWKEA